MQRQTRRLATIVSLVILLGWQGFAQAGVWVNGRLLQPQELYQLQSVYGEPIPPGRYWLDQQGNWGYEGTNQRSGNIYTDNRPSTYQPSSTGNGQAWVDNHGSSGSVMKDRDGCMYISGGGVSASTC